MVFNVLSLSVNSAFVGFAGGTAEQAGIHKWHPTGSISRTLHGRVCYASKGIEEQPETQRNYTKRSGKKLTNPTLVLDYVR